MNASAAVSGSDIVVTINTDQWRDGRAGVGRLEVKNVTGDVTTFPFSRQLRILPGIEAWGEERDYGW